MQVTGYISKQISNIFEFLLKEINLDISQIILNETLFVEKADKLTDSEKKHCKTVAKKIQDEINKKFKQYDYSFSSRFNKGTHE